MAQLTVRNVDEEIVAALKQRAKQNERSAEAEHRKILQDALVRAARSDAFFDAAKKLRRPLEVSEGSTTDLIQMDRDRAN